MKDLFIRIGQIVSTHGLKGQVKVTPLTDFLDRFDKGARLRLEDDWVTIQSVGEKGHQLILKLSGIDDIDQADKVRGDYLYASAAERPELEEDEYFTEDLVGLEAVTVDGEKLGKVDSVVAAPAHDLLVIGEMMVPAVKAFVKKVDLSSGVITLELIPGMRPGEA